MEFTTLLTTISAISSMNDATSKSNNALKNANSQAEAYADEGNLAVAAKVKDTRYAAAKATVSFLSSGLTLEGTPGQVIDETYQTGIDDASQLRKNYNRAIKNALSEGKSKSKAFLSEGRTAAINAIGDSQVLANSGGGGGFSGLFGDLKESIGGSMNSAGYGVQAYDLLDDSNTAQSGGSIFGIFGGNSDYSRIDM